MQQSLCYYSLEGKNSQDIFGQKSLRENKTYLKL